MEKERIHIVIAKSKQDESSLIVDLFISDGWKVDYQCEEKDNPQFITTELIRV